MIPFLNNSIVARLSVVALVLSQSVDQPIYAQDTAYGNLDSPIVIADILKRMAELESEVTSLRAALNDDWLTNERADEIRGHISAVLADVDKRTVLLNEKTTAGYDDHFFLSSPDGNFRLELSGQVQLRFVYNHLESIDDSNQVSFENRRTKLKFSGHVINPRLRYSITGAFDDRSGGFSLNGAYVSYALTDDFTIRAGRVRPPLLREEDVSSKRQLLAERSIIARTFKQNRTTGLGFQFEQDVIRLRGAFMDGTKDRFGDQSFIAAGRVEVLLAGEWKQLRDFTSFRSDEPLISLGAGVLIREEDFEDTDDNDGKLFRWAADVSMEFGGANLFAAIVGNHVDEEKEIARNQFGVVLQGGLFLTDEIELFAQYVWGDADGKAPDLSVLTAGFNYYLAKHSLKWTMDIGYAFNEVGDFWASGSTGFRENDAGDDGQIVVRGQWQLLF